MPDDPFDSSPRSNDQPPSDSLGVTGLPPNISATLAVMIPLIGGIAFLFLERKDRLVRFYSIQSIVLGVLLGAAYLVLGLVQFIFSPIGVIGPLVIKVATFVYGIFALFWLALYFIAMGCAFMGRIWALPYLGPMAKRYLSNKMR